MNCTHCTYLNPPNTQICQMCSKSLDVPNVKSEGQLDGIVCNTCTFINTSDADSCSVCGLDFDVENTIFDDSDDTYDTCSTDSYVKLNEHEINEIAEKTKDKLLIIDGKTVDSSQRECELCYELIGSDFFAMIECIHTFCNNCAVQYFTIQITERTILDCNCPICNYPNLRANEDQHGEYFSLLLASLKSILDENIMNVFEKKLTETALLSDPNFVWCIRCTSGFVNDPATVVAQCPDCRVRFCFQCKKIWESQHMRISCEQFANWQRDNNPELSKEAILNYLQKNGIDCPKCKFKYDLSRGGCIHFTCSQCKYEFCFGCSKPFATGVVCKVSSYCKNVGLHAHHVRNCYYFLRDKTVAELQGLLKANNIQFLVESSGHNNTDQRHCPIELQIERGSSIVDTICKEPTEKGQAGLCRKHYTEYLIVTITNAKIETLSILTVHNCQELLRFQGITIPAQSSGQSNDEYKEVCKKLVKNNIALHL